MAFHTLSLLHFPLLYFPPLRSTAFSTPAFSAPPAVWSPFPIENGISDICCLEVRFWILTSVVKLLWKLSTLIARAYSISSPSRSPCMVEEYMMGLFTLVADMHHQRAAHRSASTCLLVRLSAIGSRDFPAAVSQIWNTLLGNVVSTSTLPSFQYHVKTFLFRRSFLRWHLV